MTKHITVLVRDENPNGYRVHVEVHSGLPSQAST